MQAIRTTFLPWTEHKPSRIKASCQRGGMTFSKEALENIAEETGEKCLHRVAARELCLVFAAEDRDKHGPDAGQTWQKPFVTGEFQNAYYHVFVE